jgi:hypothetical protein
MIMIVLFKMVGIVNMLNLAHQLVLLNVEITFQPVNRNVMMVIQKMGILALAHVKINLEKND